MTTTTMEATGIRLNALTKSCRTPQGVVHAVRRIDVSISPGETVALGVDEALGIADVADRRTQKRSGGQTQRARFAVAVVSDPELLVLDEPTVTIDVEGRRALWSAMRAFAARGKTVVFAAHALVVAGWTVALTALARLAFRRDTKRA
jgi:energy-coupling factor transporter ATP-binding protein EcfA2